MAVTLADYLHAAAAEALVYGRQDCCQNLRRWILARTGRDPAAGHAYASRSGAARILRRAGGLEALCGELARSAGLAPVTGEPGRGDVGVVRMGGRVLGAICDGRRWVAPGDCGLVAGPAEVLAAWSVP